MSLEHESLIHVQSSLGIPGKISNSKQIQPYYFSSTPELLFNRFVSPKTKDDGRYGYFGLPSAQEVAQDIMIQIPETV